MIYDAQGNPVELSASHLKSLKLGILGDSITEGTGASVAAKSYAAMLGAEFASINNYGIGGSCMSQHWSKPMVGRWSSMASTLDFIIIFGGVNDFYASAPLGDNDSTTTTDFNGALNVIIDGLLNKYPAKQLLLVTPPQTNNGTLRSDQQNSAGLTMADYVDAIKERATHYAVPVCDLYAEYANIANSAAVKTALSADGIHPNDAGHDRIYRRILGTCKRIVGE